MTIKFFQFIVNLRTEKSYSVVVRHTQEHT